MELLRSRPVSHDPDDGARATYECWRCLRQTTVIVDAYDTPDRISCSQCGIEEMRQQ